MSDFTVNDYYQVIMAQAINEAQMTGVSTELQFLKNMLSLLSDAGEFDEYHVIEGKDSANRWRLDAYEIDQETRHLNLFISVFDDATKPANLTATDLKGFISKLKKFLDVVLENDTWITFEPGSETWAAAEAIKSFWTNVRAINYYIISNKPLSKVIGDITAPDYRDFPATIHIWDLGRFYNLELSGREREEMRVDLSHSPIPCLVTSESTGEMTSLLAVISGPVLFDLYDKWRARLLEQNVRTYLSNRGNINKGIRRTIKENPEYFFAYNNGLTTTAEEIVFTDETNSAIKEIKNFQIVNGGQTTSSIYAAVIKDNVDVTDVSVQMKLTVVKPENVERLVPKIAEYANSQNKVSAADLFSNHPYHVRIEEISRRLFAPAKPGSAVQTQWFYERARGQYVDSQAYKREGERKLFAKQSPRDQLITKTDLGKFENSWISLPYEVSKGAQANFQKFAERISKLWEKNDAFFGEAYFKKCVVHALIFRALEKQVLKQPWYDGYRAPIVNYTISLFAEQLSLAGKSLNYDHLYRIQNCPGDMVTVLLHLAEKADAELRKYSGNLSTYAKTQAAWQNLKDAILPVDISQLEDYFWNADDIKKSDAESAKVQTLDSTLKGEIKVQTLSPDQWDAVIKYLVSMDLATAKKLDIINLAKLGRSLTEAQIKVLEPLVSQYEKDKSPFVTL
ncbi:AIPR family protein [Porticoccaceae bacterium nBUS_09]